MIQVSNTAIAGVKILEPQLFGDARGYFFESYNARDFERLVGAVHFVQDNESRSVYGVVRGLHFQKGDKAQAKLVRCVLGRIWDVAVDLRPDSPTFGHYVGIELSAENHRQFFIPRGCAHGFSVLSPEAIFQYKCDNFYAPAAEGALRWDDPDLGIDWHVPVDAVILSEKDSHHPSFREWKETLA